MDGAGTPQRKDASQQWRHPTPPGEDHNARTANAARAFTAQLDRDSPGHRAPGRVNVPDRRVEALTRSRWRSGERELGLGRHHNTGRGAVEPLAKIRRPTMSPGTSLGPTAWQRNGNPLRWRTTSRLDGDVDVMSVTLDPPGGGDMSSAPVPARDHEGP